MPSVVHTKQNKTNRIYMFVSKNNVYNFVLHYDDKWEDTNVYIISKYEYGLV
mgnify:CR=1 FL=1